MGSEIGSRDQGVIKMGGTTMKQMGSINKSNKFNKLACGMLIGLLVAGFSAKALADIREQDGYIAIHDIVTGGSGCSSGSVDIRFDEELESLVLRPTNMKFDNFGGTSRVARLTCSIAIPVSVPRGYRIGFIGTSTHQLVAGSGGIAEVSEEYFIPGVRGTPVKVRVQGPARRFVDTRTVVGDKNIIWTGCGESANLRANLSILGMKKAAARTDQIRLLMILDKCVGR